MTKKLTKLQHQQLARIYRKAAELIGTHCTEIDTTIKGTCHAIKKVVENMPNLCVSRERATGLFSKMFRPRQMVLGCWFWKLDDLESRRIALFIAAQEAASGEIEKY